MRDRPFRLFVVSALCLIVVLLAVLLVRGPQLALFGLAPPAHSSVAEARASKVAADLQTISNTLQMFQLDVKRCPTPDEGLASLMRAPASAPGWAGPYLRNGLPSDPWGSQYRYEAPSGSRGFVVRCAGEDGQIGTADDVTLDGPPR